jgi:UDP-N-acetyl-D-galactosamine dehydrogenase
VLIMGVTYKENVEDTRETPARDIIKELQDYGIEVIGYDPVAKDPEKAFGIKFISDLSEAPLMDCVIVTIAHDVFKGITIESLRRIMNSHPVLIDIRGLFDTQTTRDAGFTYRRL